MHSSAHGTDVSGRVHGNTPRQRQTIARRLVRGGLGVHGGRPAHAEIAPAPCGFGLRINGAPVRLSAVIDGRGATTLQTPAGPVRTVEHLLAALSIAGIDDARVTVTGGEVPILDGSARGWMAETRPHGGRVDPYRLTRRIRVDDGDGWAEVTPAARLTLDVSIDFSQIGALRVRVTDPTTVLDARTFGFRADLAHLHAAGLALGANLSNTLVFDDGPMSPLRTADEPARHKAADLIGDLALLGRPLCAHVRVHRGTHRLHHQLVKAILDSDRVA
ncbi:MAG: UDP-3-O-[3-hydroxymyristoyl] N-acetylglucosamine deacetylase [Bradymonadia bacterium]|jgi:UDP-3-O-[3-hydroxymyristoyl] N-acetylglucosamine deacetylase